MNDTTGYIYFYLKTENINHDLYFFNRYLSIKPTNFHRIGKKGNTPKCTSWEFSSGELTDQIYHIEVVKLVEKLKVHKDEFLTLKKEYKEIQMVLQVVVYLKEDNPQLYFSKEVIDFVNYLGAEIDCDIYNNK